MFFFFFMEPVLFLLSLFYLFILKIWVTNKNKCIHSLPDIALHKQQIILVSEHKDSYDEQDSGYNTWQKITDNKGNVDGGFVAYVIVLRWYTFYSPEL